MKIVYLFITVRSLCTLFNIIHLPAEVLKHAESDTFVRDK